jgi:hypothetical protein
MLAPHPPLLLQHWLSLEVGMSLEQGLSQGQGLAGHRRCSSWPSYYRH